MVPGDTQAGERSGPGRAFETAPGAHMTEADAARASSVARRSELSSSAGHAVPATTPAGGEKPASGVGRRPAWQPAFAIFEGGGAKGITHIGALKALEEEDFALVGTAGASAGAIIAALAAVGYRADELFGATEDVLSRRELTPVDLLGRRRWLWFRFLTSNVGQAAAALPWLFVLVLLMAYTGVPGWIVAVGVGAALLPLALIAALVAPVLARRGFLSTDAMRDQLNALLYDRLAEHYQRLGRDRPPEQVRFQDIDPTEVDGCCRLKIIVSDARGRRLVQFDQSTPEVVIADAVAASAAIPLVFRPPEVEGARRDTSPVFVDGGLVSNLPVWAFAAEKLAFERELGRGQIPIFAFTLLGSEEGAPAPSGPARPGARSRRPPPFLEHIRNVVETGIFGSQGIVQEFVRDLTVVDLRSPLTTLDFDCDRAAASAAVEAGRSQASAVLKQRRRSAAFTRKALERLLEDATAKVAERRVQDGRPAPRLRVSLLDPGRAGSFRITGQAGMDAYADDQMQYDGRNEAGPRAFVERRPTFVELSSPQANLWMTKYERAMVPRDLRSVISVPVFPLPPTGSGLPGSGIRPQRVLSLDSDDSLESEFHDPSFMHWLEGRSLVLSRNLVEENQSVG